MKKLIVAFSHLPSRSTRTAIIGIHTTQLQSPIRRHTSRVEYLVRSLMKASTCKLLLCAREALFVVRRCLRTRCALCTLAGAGA